MSSRAVQRARSKEKFVAVEAYLMILWADARRDRRQLLLSRGHGVYNTPLLGSIGMVLRTFFAL